MFIAAPNDTKTEVSRSDPFRGAHAPRVLSSTPSSKDPVVTSLFWVAIQRAFRRVRRKSEPDWRLHARVRVLPGSGRHHRAFTLLEILLAVAILGMMALSIYRFVQSNIQALRISSEMTVADVRFDALREILANQWQGLPPGSGALLGETLKLQDRARDEVKWVCGAGPGLLTRYAGGDYTVTLRLQPESKKGDRFEIGFLRKPKDDQALTNAHESFIPLIQDVQSLQIRYFDPRLNVWLDKWTDTVTLPRLIKVTIGRNDAAVAWEAIIPLGRTPL